MRELVTKRKIGNIKPIEGADLIEVVSVDGWEVIASKGEFRTGDDCLYFEIDSFLPIRPEFEFLRPRCFKKMGVIDGFRLRTIRLRKQVSQGLVVPLSKFPEINDLAEGTDLAEILGVQKYEPPIPLELVGQAAGSFPSFIQRTDQPRCQNEVGSIFIDNVDSRYEITLKCDGSSLTAFHVDGEDGVCSRNWELKVNEANEHNAFVRMYVDSSLRSALVAYGRNLAVQGELLGPGIQQNRENLPAAKLFIFDIYDIDGGCKMSPDERRIALEGLYANGLNKTMVEHVPIYAYNVTLGEMGITDIKELLKDADGPSIVHSVREGKVYKRMDGKFSFKAISNDYLVKEK